MNSLVASIFNYVGLHPFPLLPWIIQFSSSCHSLGWCLISIQSSTEHHIFPISAHSKKRWLKLSTCPQKQQSQTCRVALLFPVFHDMPATLRWSLATLPYIKLLELTFDSALVSSSHASCIQNFLSAFILSHSPYILRTFLFVTGFSSSSKSFSTWFEPPSYMHFLNRINEST